MQHNNSLPSRVHTSNLTKMKQTRVLTLCEEQCCPFGCGGAGSRRWRGVQVFEELPFFMVNKQAKT
jgi:hypothetical protein